MRELGADGHVRVLGDELAAEAGKGAGMVHWAEGDEEILGFVVTGAPVLTWLMGSGGDGCGCGCGCGYLGGSFFPQVDVVVVESFCLGEDETVGE